MSLFSFSKAINVSKVISTFFLLSASFLTFQANAQCDVNNPYDKIISGYHASIAIKTNGIYSVWGASMKSDGVTDQLVPQDIDGTNYPGLTGTIIKAAIGGQTSGLSVDQGILLTTTGLWAWGIEGVVINNSLTSSKAFARITSPSGAQSTGLPVGVSPIDIKAMFATFQTLLLLTNAGNVWVLTQTSLAVEGNGGTSSTVGSSTWKEIKTDALNYLDNVKNVRGQVSGVGYNAFIAETTSGQLYTWGNTTFLGNSTTASARNYATLMTLPVGLTTSDINMFGVTGGDGGASVANTYYLLSNNGNLYSLGDNKERQCGDFTTIDRTDWVRVQKSATANDYLSNIKYISSQEHNSSYPAASAITTSGGLYTWGSNSKNMLGRPVDGDLYNPGVPDGFTSGDKALFVEVGGHTIVYAKLGSAKFCYVGHRIQGSMGDNTSTSATEASFNCTSTPTLDICGSVPVAADLTKSTITPNPTLIIANGTSTSTITVQLKNASDVNLTTTGGTVIIYTSKGTIGTVTDNNNGTYTSILTSTSNIESATLTFTINASNASASTTVNFISSGATPTITTSGTLKDFASCSGCTVTPQSFTVSGADLTNNIVVTAPTGFQVSNNAGASFASSITLTQTSGTLTTTTVYVKLANNATTASGGNITIASTGATSHTITATANTDNALNFDGTDDFVNIPDNNALDVLNVFTVEAWVNPASSSGSQVIIGKIQDVNTGNAADLAYALRYNSGVLRAEIGDGSGAQAITTNGLVTNKWQHIAMVFNGATVSGVTGALTLYIDGVKQGNTLATGYSTLKNVSTSLKFGAYGQYFNQYYIGLLDNVKIWNTAKSQSELAAGLNTELNGNETGLVAYYNFNHGIAGGINSSITTIDDRTSNTFTGTLNGFAKTGATSNFISGTIPEITAAGNATNLASGSTLQLANALTGGTWSSTNTSFATIDASTGLVTGVAAGAVTFTYSICNKIVNYALSIFSATTPIVTLTGSLNTFTSCSGCTVSPQSFTVSGADLTNDIVVTAPTGFQVSNNAGASFASSIILTPVSGTVTSTTVYTKLTDNAIAAASGVISVTSIGATTKTITATVNTDNALNFNGTYIATSNPIFTDGQQNFTMEFWINPTDASQTWRGIIGGYVTNQTDRVPSIWQFGRKLHFDVVGFNTTTSYGGYTVDALNIGKWNHVAFVKDGAEIKLFVNGTQVEIYLSNYTGTSQLFKTAPAQFKSIANYKIGMVDNYFNGAVDEIKFWNNAKSITDIANNMYNESVGNETGLLAYFKFNLGAIGGNTNGVTLTSIGAVNLSPSASGVTNIVAGFIPEIAGNTSVNLGSSITLTNGLAGGIWASSASGVATIDANGVIAALSGGATNITYTICNKVVAKTITVIAPTPTITTTGTLNTFTTCASTASAAQTFTITGNNLSNNITLTAPSGYELSTTSGGTFSTTISLTQLSGVVSATQIFVRLTANAINAAAGNITATSTGASIQTIATGAAIVNALPASPTISSSQFNATVCEGAPVILTAIAVPTATNYLWNDPATSSTAAITVSPIANTTYTVTATNANGCASTASITVRIANPAGNFGNALNFDGINDAVLLGANSPTFQNTTTIETWVKALNNTNDKNILSWGYALDGVFNWNDNVQLRLSGHKLQWGMHSYSNNLGWQTVTSNKNIDDGVWHHIAIVKDGNTSSMYIDGELEVSRILTHTMTVNRFVIGAAFGGSTNSQFFNGSIDELRIWNAALTLDEIRSRMNRELIGNEPNLIALYNFNEGVAGANNTTITTINNSTTNAHDGTIADIAMNGTGSNFVVGHSFVLPEITGNTIIALGGNTSQLSNALYSGIWSITTNTFVTINSAGLLTSTNIGQGTATVTYTLSSSLSCSSLQKSILVTVDPAANITGPSGNAGDATSIESINENTTPVFTFTANETVSWSIVGGSDVAKFAINSITGALSFITEPDYEIPTDVNTNNTYIVIINAVDAAGNISEQTVTVTVLDVYDNVPPSPTLVGGVYLYGSIIPSLPAFIQSLPPNTIPVWCNTTTNICSETHPATPIEVGRYIFQVRSYDTLSKKYSIGFANDTIIVKPLVPLVRNATYIIGLNTNPANIGVQVSGMQGSLLNYFLLASRQTAVPVLGTTVSVKRYTVSQTVNEIESDTVGFNVAMLNQNDMVHLQKLAEEPILQSNSTFNITYKFIVNNLSADALTNVLITDNLQNTIPLTAEYTIVSISATGGLVANSSFNGSTNTYLTNASSNVNAFAKDTLMFTLNIKPKGFTGVMNNTATIAATSRYGAISMVSSAATKISETSKSPTPVIIPDVIIDIPEVFSPNRDGVNDRFVIIKPFGTTLNLEIFNRWGNIVYANPNYNNEWDGRGTNNFIGQDLLDGGYYYNLKAINKNGETKIFKGFVIIQR